MMNVGSWFSKRTKQASEGDDDGELDSNSSSTGAFDDGLTPQRRILVKKFTAVFDCFLETSYQGKPTFKQSVLAYPCELTIQFDLSGEPAFFRIMDLAKFVSQEERKFGIKDAEISNKGVIKFTLDPDRILMEVDNTDVPIQRQRVVGQKRKLEGDEQVTEEAPKIKRYKTKPPREVAFPKITPAAQGILDSVPFQGINLI